MTKNPTTRAVVATIFFSVVAGWSVLFHDVPWDITIPHLIFYAVLTINTYFSIRFYTDFTPESGAQTLIDGALVALYAALALTIGLPRTLAFLALVMFIVATMKYAHLLQPQYCYCILELC